MRDAYINMFKTMGYDLFYDINKSVGILAPKDNNESLELLIEQSEVSKFTVNKSQSEFQSQFIKYHNINVYKSDNDFFLFKNDKYQENDSINFTAFARLINLSGELTEKDYKFTMEKFEYSKLYL